jgi:hypothetical protein
MISFLMNMIFVAILFYFLYRKIKSMINDWKAKQYAELKEDIIIFSKSAEDTTEQARFDSAVEMVETYNNYGISVFICEYRDKKNYNENWADYRKRCKVFTKNAKEQRVKAIANDEDAYKTWGRNLAKQL